MKCLQPILLLALSGAALAQAPSQGPSPLRLLLSQELVTSAVENGRTVEQFTPAPRTVRPGDTLTQQVTASNVGRSALKNAGINLPVPRGTVYLGGATPGGRWVTQFSRDGGKTFGAAPLRKTVTVTENGRAVQKEVTVPPGEYTNVRWVIAALQPGETLKLGFRVQVR